jgi:hypothetical protein
MSGEDWLGCPQCGLWTGHEPDCPLAPDPPPEPEQMSLEASE